ncbi:MAG: Re/Si-specific NAD(P)(+) transhydrogenase subunit alpha [Chitinophagaceae bacterium]
MKIGVLRESSPETRVSFTPETISAIIKKGHAVTVETGAGSLSFFSDDDYRNAGATVSNRGDVFGNSELILCIHTPEDLNAVKSGQVMVGAFMPLTFPAITEKFVKGNITAFSLDLLPRTTRAQSMDILSSQANIAGYKAVLTAATHFSHYFPMFMTAAGSIPPAKVLILGAGVAGLQAIATAKRLGAVVEVFDTRPAVKEEVQSLGAKFVEVEGAADATKAGGYAVEQTEEYKQKQQSRIAEAVRKSDIIITTAQIPGKTAPLLITEEMVHSMKKGSVIVDLAASTGGNKAFTKNNEIVHVNGVLIIGNSNLPSGMPSDASKLFAKNVFNFIQLLTDKEGVLALNFEDDLVKGSCITHEGAIIHERLKK